MGNSTINGHLFNSYLSLPGGISSYVHWDDAWDEGWVVHFSPPFLGQSERFLRHPAAHMLVNLNLWIWVSILAFQGTKAYIHVYLIHLFRYMYTYDMYLLKCNNTHIYIYIVSDFCNMYDYMCIYMCVCTENYLLLQPHGHRRVFASGFHRWDHQGGHWWDCRTCCIPKSEVPWLHWSMPLRVPSWVPNVPTFAKGWCLEPLIFWGEWTNSAGGPKLSITEVLTSEDAWSETG